MILYFITSLTGIITMMFLDYLWLAKLAKGFYLEKLNSHVVITNGSLVPYLPAVPLVYIIAIAAIWVIAISNSTTLAQSFFQGALLGFFLYAFYDFTNLATLKDYPWSLAIVDIVWGTLLIGVTSSVMFLLKSFIS